MTARRGPEHLATDHFPGALEIVDLFHATERLHELGTLVAPALADDSSAWLVEHLNDLDKGDVVALTIAAREVSVSDAKQVEVEKALAYFETNAARMAYAHFRSLGVFVGSR